MSFSSKGDQVRTIKIPDHVHYDIDDVIIRMDVFNLDYEKPAKKRRFRGHLLFDKHEIWRVFAPTRALVKRRLEMRLGDISRMTLSALYGPILVMPSK